MWKPTLNGRLITVGRLFGEERKTASVVGSLDRADSRLRSRWKPEVGRKIASRGTETQRQAKRSFQGCAEVCPEFETPRRIVFRPWKQQGLGFVKTMAGEKGSLGDPEG
jgi:hypothetical protein